MAEYDFIVVGTGAGGSVMGLKGTVSWIVRM